MKAFSSVVCFVVIHSLMLSGMRAATASDESSEYYDDDADDDDNDNVEPQSSQNDEVQQNSTGDDPLQKLLPYITFNCTDRLEGYYADVEFGCEVFHYCKKEDKRFSFICPPNSTFNQKLMICDYDKAAKASCLHSPKLFHLNKQLYGIKRHYKFPEYVTSESQNVEQTFNGTEMTTSGGVERRVSDPEVTTAATTPAPNTEQPPTPIPKRARIRTKLARPTTTPRPAAPPPQEKAPTPVKKLTRRRKPRPSPSPKPQETPEDAVKKRPTFGKKPRPSRKPQDPSQVQPAPPEHLTHQSEPVNPVSSSSRSQEDDPIPPSYPSVHNSPPPSRRPPKNNSGPNFPQLPPPTFSQAFNGEFAGRPSTFEAGPHKPNEDFPVVRVPSRRPSVHRVPARPKPVQTPPPSTPYIPPSHYDSFRRPAVQPKKSRKKSPPVKNELLHYERMFSTPSSRGVYPPPGSTPRAPPVAPAPFTPVPHERYTPGPSPFAPPSEFPPPTQHSRQQPVRHFQPHLGQPLPQRTPQELPTQFTVPPSSPQPQFQRHLYPTPNPYQSSLRFSDPSKQHFDPGRPTSNGNAESHFFGGPEALPQFGSHFGAAGSAAGATSLGAQPNFQNAPRPGQTPQFDYMFSNSRPQHHQPREQQPRQPQFAQDYQEASPQFYQINQGYTPVPGYDMNFGVLFGSTPSGDNSQTYLGAPPSASTGSSSFQQHVHHIHSRKRRSADFIEIAADEEPLQLNVAKSRQRRQFVFSRLPKIFSRKSNRQSGPYAFASASTLNSSFGEIPGFYGGRFNHQLSSENAFPNFGGGFSRFFSGPSPAHGPLGQSSWGGSGPLGSLQVPSPMALGPGSLFSRSRNSLSVGGPSTFTATSLGQLPSKLGMSPNYFFTRTNLKKPIQAKNSAGKPSSMLAPAAATAASGEDILPASGTLSQTGLKPSANPLIPDFLHLPPRMAGLQPSAGVVEEDAKTAISYIPMAPEKITVTLDSIENTGSGSSSSPMSFPPKRLRPADAKEVLYQLRSSYRPVEPGELTPPNDFISEVSPPGAKREPASSNSVHDSTKSIPYPSHLARNPDKFFNGPPQKVNSFHTPQFLIPQTQYSPQMSGYGPQSFGRGTYFPVKSGFRPPSANKFLDFGGLPDVSKPTQRPIPAVRQPPPMPAHLDSSKSQGATASTPKPQKKRNKTRKRRPKPSTSRPLPPSMIEVVVHEDSGLNVHLKGGSEATTLPSVITTTSKRVWPGSTTVSPRYETQFPIKFNYITTSSSRPTTSTTTPRPFSQPPTTATPSRRVYHNLVTPSAKNFEHKLPQRLEVTNAPLYKNHMFPPRVMATNVPHEMTVYARYTTTPMTPSAPIMRTVDLSTTTTTKMSPPPTTPAPVSSTPAPPGSTAASVTPAPSSLPPTTTTEPPKTTTAAAAVATTTPRPLSSSAAAVAAAAATLATSAPVTGKPRSATEAPTIPDEIFDFFTFPTTSAGKESTTTPGPVFLPQSAISRNHELQEGSLDTEKENMTASASVRSYSTLKPVLKVFSNRAGGTSWYKFKAMMATSTTPRPPLKMLNAVPVSDGYEKGFPFEFFTDLSLLAKTTGRPATTTTTTTTTTTDFPQPVYNPGQPQT